MAQVKDRKKCPRGENHKACHTVGLKEIEKVCRGGPEVLFVGAGRSSRVKVAKVAAEALQSEAIGLRALPTPQAIRAYNADRRRKAILLHVTC